MCPEVAHITEKLISFVIRQFTPLLATPPNPTGVKWPSVLGGYSKKLPVNTSDS